MHLVDLMTACKTELEFAFRQKKKARPKVADGGKKTNIVGALPQLT